MVVRVMRGDVIFVCTMFRYGTELAPVNSGRPPLIHGFLGSVRILTKSGWSAVAYADYGLEKGSKNPTLRELCCRYNDLRSLQLYEKFVRTNERFMMSAGREADYFILSTCQRLVNDGHTQDNVRILSCDRYLRYTYQFKILEDALYGDAADYLAPFVFDLEQWTFRCDALDIPETKFWKL